MPSSSKVRTEPRLSAFQLADYIVASEVRKISILREAKYPDTGGAKIPQYQIAIQGAARFLVSPYHDPAILESASEKLLQRRDDTSLSPWVRDEAKRSLSALQIFARSHNTLGLKKQTFEKPPGNLPPLVIKGVTVNVEPELLVVGVHKDQERIGSGFIRMAQGSGGEAATEHRKDAYCLLAALGHMHTARHLKTQGSAHEPFSLVIDVPRAEVYRASGLIKRGERIAANCQFIKSLWKDL
jgi:hypothetical protein